MLRHERRADTAKVDLGKMEGQVKLMTDKLFCEHVRKIPSILKTRSDTKIKERPWNSLFPSADATEAVAEGFEMSPLRSDAR